MAADRSSGGHCAHPVVFRSWPPLILALRRLLLKEKLVTPELM